MTTIKIQWLYLGILKIVLPISIALLIPSVFAETKLARLINIYEASAAQTLPDGRILVAEDEPERALHFIKMDEQGRLMTLDSPSLLNAFEQPLDDLEGRTMDKQGYIYAITSHSPNKKGQRKASREQLLRFRINGNAITEIRYINNLLSLLDNDEQLQKKYPNIDFYDSNIEGLSFDIKNNRLLLGFKSPLVNKQSMLIGINNVDKLFNQTEKAQFTSPILLKLQKGGIRAITYSFVLEKFILANEVYHKKGKKYSNLWLWNGKDNSPKKLNLPVMKKYKNIEALTIVSRKGKNYVLAMCDDGKEKKGKGSHFFLLKLNHSQSKINNGENNER